MKIKLFAIGLLALLMVSAAGPSFAGRANAAAPSAHVASAPQAHPAFLDKTRFLIDMGVAFWCIHHVYAKYKTGYYASGESGRVKHIIAAGVVLFIAYNRLQAAYKTANKSNSATLHKLVSPLNTLLGKTQSTATALKGGTADSTSIQDLNNTTSQVGSQANSGGYTIKDIQPPVGVPAGA